MAMQEIRVGLQEGIDPRGNRLVQQLNPIGLPISNIRTSTIYRFEDITEKEAERLAQEVLTDANTQKYSLNAPLYTDAENSIEIGYKTGVMNPVRDSLLHVANSIGIHPSAASSSTEYNFYGNITPELATTIGNRIASQVEEVVWQKPETLLITGEVGPVEKIHIEELDETGLDLLSKTRSLFLNTAEMRVIQDHFRLLGKDPTDVELETLAQTWSEHNGHKTFKARLIEQQHERPPLMQRLREAAQKHFDKVGVVTAFADNAGGITFYDGFAIIGKGETHNSPVAIEPYGGSETKNGGVYRDIAGTGQGGENLVAFMVNCFAPPDTPLENVPPGCLTPLNLLLENSRGERDYGNKMGIPTHGVSIHTHPDFVAKPTSMGITIGIIPEARVRKGEPQPDDLLVTVGGKTGRDGIHGATFSSGEMTSDTKNVHATAVQIGNAIEEKRMFDALIAARDADLIQAITDCGGGGYSSAIGEIAEDVGVEVDLSRVPLKYTGLAPWEIWLSESQERMIVALDPANWEAFQAICDRFDTPAEVIGTFTGDRTLTLKHNNGIVGQLPMDFLHHGLPQQVMKMEYRPVVENNDLPPITSDWQSTLKQVLGHMNVASKELMLRQYDQSVQGRTVLYPFTGVYQDMPNDASIVAPLYGKPYGVVTTHALNPILNKYDPYEGSVWAVAAAASKYTAVGGNIHEAAMIDNFVWPKPTPQFLGDLDHSIDALCDMMDLLEVPCVSGKDSLSSSYHDPKNEWPDIHIPPLLNITMFGKIPDIQKTISADIKSPNSVLIMVGSADVDNLGGSVYFQTQQVENSRLSQLDKKNFVPVLQSIHDAIQTGEVKSCKAIAEGGLAATIAQMCFGGDCGADIDISPLQAQRPDLALFHETAGCFIVEVDNVQVADDLFRSVPYAVLGHATPNKEIVVSNGNLKLFDADLYDLKETWQRPMKEVFS